MKRLGVLVGIIAVIAIAVLLIGLERVPEDRVGLRVDGNGALEDEISAGAHWHFPPGPKLVLYPAGPDSLIFPADEDLATYRLYDADGEEITTRFLIDYRIEPGRAAELHRVLFGGGSEDDASATTPPGASGTSARVIPAAMGDPVEMLPDTVRVRLRGAARRVAAGFSSEALATDEGMQRLANEIAWSVDLAGVHLTARPLTGKVRGDDVHILMVGVDAGDWILIDPLLAAGRMPHLAGLLERGVRVDFHSIMPMLSPLLWTSIATSTTPDRHGILDFLTPDPSTGEMVPVTSTLRREPAFWNILTQYGVSQAVIAWLATWPAETVSGHFVTERFGFLAYAGLADDAGNQGMTWPPDYVEHARSLEVDAASLPPSFWRRFFNRPESELTGLGRGGFKKGDLENNFALTVATALTSTAIAEDVQRTEAPRVTAVYYEMIDALGHLTMPYAPPRQPHISEEDYRLYSGAMDAAYEFQDELLGRLLADCDLANTVVMVLSDHGMRSGDARPRGLAEIEGGAAARWHRDPGMLAIAGPGIRKGETLTTEVDILDIAPTLLSILNLPVPRTMQGRVLTEAFDDVGQKRYAPDMVDAIELRPEVWAPQRTAPDAKASAPATASLHNNLGMVYEAEGDLAAAEAEYRLAIEAVPSDNNARNNLASILLQTGRTQAAGEILEAIHRDTPSYFAALYNLGVFYQQGERWDDAERMFRSVLDQDPSHNRARVDLGHALLRSGRVDEARAEFERALESNPALPNAQFGMGLLAAQSGDLETARARFTRTLELDPEHRSAEANLRRIEEMTRRP